MRLQVYFIAAIVSSMMWVGSFSVAQKTYRFAHQNDIIPNMHIWHKIDNLIS